MFSILTGLMLSCLFLLAVLGTVLAVMSVLDHARSDPAAAKAIYDHVFVPIFVGKPDSKPERKLVASAKPVEAVTEPSEPEWKC